MINPNDLPQGGATLPKKGWKNDGFNLGVDSFSLPTEVSNNALVSAQNAELYGRKSVRPRRGGAQLGTAIGAATQVDGLFPFKDTENDVNILVAIAGGDVMGYNTLLDDFDTLHAAQFVSGLRTRGTKLRGAYYLGNGTDKFAKFDGSLVTKYSVVTAPTNLAVAATGGTGTTRYGYTATAVTAKGQSLPCATVSITNGVADLDATHYNRVTFDRNSDSQVIGYNIFGRKDYGTGMTEIIFIEQPTSGATITWDDNGGLTPTIWLPPEGDDTDGPRLKIWDQLRGSLVGGGDPLAVHRMYFSGTGGAYESFSPSQNGGWIDIRPGDNDEGIMAFAPFETKIIIFKQESIGQFYFSTTTGDAIYQELITYVGCGATGSVVVMENDVAFIDSERKFRILGYEPNFQTAIRTTSLSEGRVDSLFGTISPEYMQNTEATYFNGRYIVSYTSTGSTKNDHVLVYDRKYLAFLGVWDGPDCHVRCWAISDAFENKKKLFAGSSDTGNVFEFSVEGVLTNYDGTIINTIIRLKNEDLGNPGQQKIWKWANYRIFRLFGTIQLKQIKNGQTTIATRTVSSPARTGWGIVRWGVMKWGLSTGVAYTASDEDKVYRKEIFDIANSLQHEIQKNDATSDFVLVSVDGEALMLPTEVFDSNNLI